MNHRLIESLVVVVAAILVLHLLFLLEGPRPALRGDQAAINLMVVKRLNPGWFQGDVLYGPDYYRYYTPSFVTAQAALARLFGDDPGGALRLLAWPTGLLFLIGHYALFRSTTGSPLAAGLGALSAMTVRNALGGEYWGFGGTSSVQPRVIAGGMTPLLVLAFLRYRTHRLFPGFFILVGGLANLHPISGFHLAQVTALTHLWIARFRWPAWRSVGIGVGLFLLGTLPFLVAYVPGREHLADPALLPTVRAALDYRFDYLLFPQKLDALLSVMFHAALPAVLLLWLRGQGRWPAEARALGTLGAVALLVGFVGTAAIQVLGWLTDRPYLDVMQLRAAKFMYVPLLAAFPLAFRELLGRRSARSQAGLVLLFLISLVPPGRVIHAVSPERRDSFKEALGIAVKPRPSPTGDPVELAQAEEALKRWVVQHADRNRLFFTDSFQFRADTLRPITGSFKDGAYVEIAGTVPFYRWYLYIREVERCRSREGANCWFELGRKYRADYVVVDPGVSKAVPDRDYAQVWSQSRWSLWQRQEKG